MWRLLSLLSIGSRHTGFSRRLLPVGLSCPGGRWNLTGTGVQPSPLHWQANSYPLYHQRNPYTAVFSFISLTSSGLSCGTRDPVSSLIRDRTWAPCVGGAES